MPAVLDHNDNVLVKQESLALHYAAVRGCLDCVKLVLNCSDNDFNTNTQMENDVTPVYLAAQEGHLDVLKFLVLEAGGSLFARAKDGMTPLHAASQMGSLNCVKWIVQEQQFDPNVKDYDGATPLHFASSRGHLDTVRWLMKHGARLSFDKFGKSPINDAAENKQVECLNILVQYGTIPDYSEQELYFNRSDISSNCSCSRKQSCSSDKELNYRNESPVSQKSSENSFYLHPQSVKSTSSSILHMSHKPMNGLYVNPMTLQRNSSFSSSCASSNESIHTGSSFYLHNPKDVIYDRVKNLFFERSLSQSQSQSQSQSEQLSTRANSITVKVDVHSQTNSSGTGSDNNFSSSDLSESPPIKSDHEYEDIYLLKPHEVTTTNQTLKKRSLSQDSGNLSQSISAASSDIQLEIEYVHVTETKPHNQTDNKKQLDASSNGSKNCGLRRSSSVQNDLQTCPPPPPPLPIHKTNKNVVVNTLTPKIHGKKLNLSCSDLTTIDLTYDNSNNKHLPNLVNKQRVLPFIPPTFPEDSNSNGLIKPSAYLKSLNDKSKLLITMESNTKESGDNCVTHSETTDYEVHNIPKPPPPPNRGLIGNLERGNAKMKSKTGTGTGTGTGTSTDEEEQKTMKKQLQPLSSISIQDLNSVQLRKVEKPAAMKTFSMPIRSMSMQSLQQDVHMVDTSVQQKQDLINELKLARGDVTGLRQMKMEKAQFEKKQEKQIYIELSKQFTAENYMNNVPDRDQNGNVIPDWKRQMLAKKAAEKAKKEFAENLQKEAEKKRLNAVPEWKKQLLAKKEETEQKIRSTIYTPKVVDDVKIIPNFYSTNGQENITENQKKDNLENETKIQQDLAVSDGNKENENVHIIPWRAQLRKTNSILNLHT